MNPLTDSRSWSNFTYIPTQLHTQSDGTSTLPPSTLYPSGSTEQVRHDTPTSKVPLPKTVRKIRKKSVKERGPQANWEPKLVECYIRLCVSEANNGNRPGAHFTRHGWENLVLKFNLATGLKYTRDQLKNKWDTMRREWGIWKALIGKDTGLGWDHVRGTIAATPEWWERKLKITPEAAKFRSKGPILLDEKEILFADNVANGSESWAPSSGILPESRQEECTDSFEEGEGDEEENLEDKLNAESNVALEQDNFVSQETNYTSQNVPPRTTAFKTQTRIKVNKKLTTGQLVVRCLDKMVDKMDTLTSPGLTSSGCSCPHTTPTGSVSECLSILATMDGVVAGGKLWLYACRILLKPNIREMFVNLPSNELRLVWLCDHMERDDFKRDHYASTNSAATGRRGQSGESEFGQSS